MTDCIDVVIEQCYNCAQHNWNNRHDEAKYKQYTDTLTEILRSKIGGVRVNVNSIPKQFVDSDNYQNLIPAAEGSEFY